MESKLHFSKIPHTSFSRKEVSVQPLNDVSILPFQRQEHVCIGISPFNSLFSELYIGDLIHWSLKSFKSFHLFLPDEPTFYTLEALGYDERECRRKMKKQLSWLRNKINKALLANDLDPHGQEYIVDWDLLSRNIIYKEELNKVYEQFDSCNEFRNSCLLASRWVLQNRIEEQQITEKSLLIAVKYFLSEIPLFAATNKILGKETSLFCYHQSIEFHQKLYDNLLSYRPEYGQGYGVIVASGFDVLPDLNSCV